MTSAITAAPPAQPVPNSAGSSQKSTQPKSEPTAPVNTDTVHLSSAAQAKVAALSESVENPGQTAKEAASGDRQAQRLLAKETAAANSDQ